MVKCDEGHNIVVVVPGGPVPSRTFWTGSCEEGNSPLICGKIRQICTRGGSTLPLAVPEQELVSQLISRLPEELTDTGLLITERKGTRGPEVLVWSFAGSRFNRILSLILTRKLGSGAQVRFNDFVVKIHRPGKTGAAARVRAALEDIRILERSRITSALPLPPAENWKFARVLPPNLYAVLVTTDYYHLDEFLETYAGMEITLSASTIPSPQPPEGN